MEPFLLRPRFQAHVFSLPETGRCGAVIHEGRGLPSGAGRPILRGCHLQVDTTNVPSKDDSIALSTWRLLSHAVSDETSGSRNHLPTCVSPSLLRVFLGPLRCDVGFRVGSSDAKPPKGVALAENFEAENANSHPECASTAGQTTRSGKGFVSSACYQAAGWSRATMTMTGAEQRPLVLGDGTFGSSGSVCVSLGGTVRLP